MLFKRKGKREGENGNIKEGVNYSRYTIYVHRIITMRIPHITKL
jgi:hypothetical protein